MVEFLIIVKNGAGCEIYNDIITARSEKEALRRFLDDNDICCGDMISIDYMD